ncbi:MAG: prolyl oligopeptidase family serine peptidase [Gemmatimonadota bacterium]
MSRPKVRPKSTACRLTRLLSLTVTLSVGMGGGNHLEGQTGYRTPPPEIVRLLDAPPTPGLNVAPGGEWALVEHQAAMPAITQLAQPMQPLAGWRVNPATRSLHAPPRILGLSVLRIADGTVRPVEMPEGGYGTPIWSPSGDRFAVPRVTDAGVELWVGEAATGEARPLSGPILNAVRGAPCSWMPGGHELLCHLVPPDQGAPPERPLAPPGPVVQETTGEEAPAWTYQDLLEDSHDEALYDHFMTSVPTRIPANGDPRIPAAAAGVYDVFQPSPNGEWFLAVRVVRPYSYRVPDARFPRQVEVLDRSGEQRIPVASMPLDESGPEHLGFARAGFRGFSWRHDAPATLAYLEALDGGDARRDESHRDRVLLLDAPFTGEPRELMRTGYRAGGGGFGTGHGILWSGEDGWALVPEYDWPTRRARVWRVDVNDPGDAPYLLMDRSADDWYGHPGTPVTESGETGYPLLLRDGPWILLTGPGGSPDGDLPFLDRMDLRTGQTERLFQTAVGSYEPVVAVVSTSPLRLLTRRESQTQPPDYHLVEPGSDARRQVTSFPDPSPGLEGIRKERLEYVRADGVPLSGDLYLPAGYQEGSRIPVLVWAYPREFADPSAAGQVRGSMHRYTTLPKNASHLYFLLEGYGVLDAAAMPILGAAEANDTFVQQLVDNAQAAVDALETRGVSERRLMGVGGHSYGAFMTANLLAHSDLFQVGLARSGAYNRTLTPFGFQYERRTYWDDPELYFNVSPFMHAHKIQTPVLLIHGMADPNSGTFPLQSERLFQALKGLGGTARLVMYPHEGHGYVARESVMDALAEMLDWFSRHLEVPPLIP